MVSKGETEEIEVSIEELDEWIEENKETLRKGKNWTPDEDAILLKYYQDVPLNLLAKYVPGRTEDAIRNRAMKLNLSKLR